MQNQLINYAVIGILISLWLCGCSSVHTTGSPDSADIAIWFGRDKVQHEKVSDVLRDRGLHPAVDDRGVAVPADEQGRAFDIILTDARLKDTGLYVMVLAQAGTGTPSGNGTMEVSIVDPNYDEADKSTVQRLKP